MIVSMDLLSFRVPVELNKSSEAQQMEVDLLPASLECRNNGKF